MLPFDQPWFAALWGGLFTCAGFLIGGLLALKRSRCGFRHLFIGEMLGGLGGLIVALALAFILIQMGG